MYFLYFVFVMSAVFFESDAYVLLQVRKNDENTSNVDALIHKVIPSNQLDNFTAHRMFTDPTPVAKGPALKDNPNTERRVNEDVRLQDSGPDSPSLEDLIDLAAAKLTKETPPRFRAKSRPVDEIALRTDDVVSAVDKMLSSSVLRKYLEKLTRKFAASIASYAS